MTIISDAHTLGALSPVGFPHMESLRRFLSTIQI